MAMTDPVAVTTVTPPALEALTLEEAKSHLRVEHEEDDAYIMGLVAAARKYVERTTNRALVPQTVRLTLQRFPSGGVIDLPCSPVSSNSTDFSVGYFVSGSTSLTTFPASNYRVDHEHEPGHIALRRNASWPSAELRRQNPIQVDFVTGYNSAGEIPEGLKLAVKFLVAHWYENREPVSSGGPVPRGIALTVDALLAGYRVWSFG